MADATTTVNKGDDGDFEVTTQGNRFRIRFKPKREKVNCKNIGLIQTARVKKDGKLVLKPSAMSPNFKPLDGDVTPGGTFVDHVATEKDPFYNGDDDPQDKSSGNKQGSSDPSAPEGPDNPKPSQETDAPQLPADADYEVEFEICAYCIGPNGRVDTSKTFGCTTVKYTQKKGKEGKAEGQAGDAAKDSSTEHKDAVKKFDEDHVKVDAGAETRVCPDKHLKEGGGIKHPIDDFPQDESGTPAPGGMKNPVPFDDEQSFFRALDKYFLARFSGESAAAISRPEVLAMANRVRATPNVAFLGYEQPQILAVKLTNVGPQLKNLPSIVFQVVEDPISLDQFEGLRTPCVSYGADEAGTVTARVSSATLDGIAEAFLSAPSSLPVDAASSAMVLYESGGTRDGTEVLLARQSVSATLRAAFDATSPDELDARNALGAWDDTFAL